EYERERQTYVSLNDDKLKFQQLFDESRDKYKDVENNLNQISSQIDRHSRPLLEKKNRILNEQRTVETYTDQISEKRDQ
uniref:Uncharacterized protein n=1 Tax=Romanomermis culicivorax TaxID=13658 RepID=A0A915KTW5_ROMCU